nr:unnamed protein product [Callosobruchus chinensis]
MKRDKNSDQVRTNSKEETPGTKVQRILDKSLSKPDSKKVEEVRRNLLFGEVVKKQLTETYSTLNTNKSKQIFQKIIDGRVVKKYKMKSTLRNTFGFRRRTQFRNYEISNFERHFSSKAKMFVDLKTKIQDFFEFEDVSRVCPDKKEYVSRNKVQKQKRYLSNTLKNLYLQFVKKYPAYKIGYSFFCKNMPFWVKTMKIAERDTCKCIQCTNMELVVKSLDSNKVLLEKTPCDVIQDMCCNSNLEECSLRTCQNCISSRPQINEFQKDDIVQYHQWVSLKSKFYDKKTRTHKQTTKMVKKLLLATLAVIENF